MPRLGGGTYKQSCLLAMSGGSQTQVIEPNTGSLAPPPTSRRAGDFVLPTMAREPASFSTPKARRMKAVESGNGSLLPDFVPLQHSNSTYSNFSMDDTRSEDSAPTPTATPESSNQSILRRRSSRMEDDEYRHYQRRGSMASTASSSSLPLHTAPRRTSPVLSVDRGFTLGHLVQTFVVMTIFYLIYDAHGKVQQASLRLEHYKDEESMLINQMDRIEGRAMQLQEQLKRLREDHLMPDESPAEQTRAETAAIQKEVQHWKRESEEVDKEVAALQAFMQQGARQEMASRYGPGTIHVDIDLDLPSGPSQLTVELFDETPHAAWVWLQQVEQGDWSSAHFIWHPAHMILASPAKATSTKLEFVEEARQGHQPWTIGLTPSDNGGYNLYINAQDNSHVHSGDVSLGKIVGGFDALQRLMHVDTVSKQPGGEKTYLEPAVALTKFGITAVQRNRPSRRY